MLRVRKPYGYSKAKVTGCLTAILRLRLRDALRLIKAKIAVALRLIKVKIAVALRTS